MCFNYPEQQKMWPEAQPGAADFIEYMQDGRAGEGAANVQGCTKCQLAELLI